MPNPGQISPQAFPMIHGQRLGSRRRPGAIGEGAFAWSAECPFVGGPTLGGTSPIVSGSGLRPRSDRPLP